MADTKYGGFDQFDSLDPRNRIEVADTNQKRLNLIPQNSIHTVESMNKAYQLYQQLSNLIRSAQVRGEEWQQHLPSLGGNMRHITDTLDLFNPLD